MSESLKARRPDLDRASTSSSDSLVQRQEDHDTHDRPVDGKEVGRMLGGAAVQRQQSLASALSEEATHDAAARGVAGSSSPLPFGGQIQAAFGGHDISNIRAHQGSEAQAASASIGARAYASGSDVAFGTTPDLHTAAHEAAHVVQQRGHVQLKGGVGQAGDTYEQHADAVADRVVAGGSATDLLDQVATAGGRGGGGGVQLLQLALADDLRTATTTAPVDPARVTALIDAAPIAEVTEVAGNATLLRQIESRVPSGSRDQVRARLARRLFIDGHQANQAWALITGDDRVRRQRYLDAYGPTAEWRAFCEGVINAGTNTGYMIRAFDSYWDVEASRQSNQQWSVNLIQRMHDSCKALPERDVRTGAWQQIILSTGGGASMAAATAANPGWHGELTIGAQASLGGQQTTTSRAAAANATTIYVANPHAFGVGSSVVIGDFATALDMPNITAVDVPGKKYTLNAPLSQAYPAGTAVSHWSSDGRAAALSTAASVGDTTVVVNDSSHFSAFLHVSFGPAPSPDMKQITQIDQATKTLTLRTPLTRAWAVGTRLSPTEAAIYGTGSELKTAAAASDTDIFVQEPNMYHVGDRVCVGLRPSPDTKEIRAVDAATGKLTLNTGLTQAYGVGATVAPDNAQGARQVDWVSAAMRHEIGHAVEAVVGGAGFRALGGWSLTNTAEAWIGEMGGDAAAFTTNDGSVISAAHIAQIKAHLNSIKGRNSATPLNHGLSPTHPINVNWNKAVPVLEAAKPCFDNGDAFWQAPQRLQKVGAKYFTVNVYYGVFQSYADAVQNVRVRSYQLFAPAEFFAENYATFYEEGSTLPDADIGRLVPDATWRAWILNNIHKRGAAPVAPGGAGPATPTGTPTGRKAHSP